MRWRRNSTSSQNYKTDEMYSQIEQVLNKFVENSKITENALDIATRWKSYSYSKQYVILLKAKELLELLKSEDSETNSRHENELNDSKDIVFQNVDVNDCSDMSLTLMTNTEHLLNSTNESDTTKYVADMEITCMESSFFETPKPTVRSILKSAQTQKSDSTRRRVRFEDELEETLAEIIENKENFNWGPKVAVAEDGCGLSVKINNLKPSNVTNRSSRPVSKGKTIETLKILSRNDKPRKSWVTCREQSADLKALSDIKTLVEIENERRQMLERKCRKYNNESDDYVQLKCGVESIETPSSATPHSPVQSGLNFSIPELDIARFRLSWTPQRGSGLDSSISFE